MSFPENKITVVYNLMLKSTCLLLIFKFIEILSLIVSDAL